MSVKNTRDLLRFLKPFSKEAKEIFLEGNDSWEGILEANPLPASISFRVRKDYMNVDSLDVMEKDLSQQTYVSDITYPKALVGELNNNIRKISIVLLAVLS